MIHIPTIAKDSGLLYKIFTERSFQYSIIKINVNGEYVTDPQDKAEALNEQFFTSFTDENDSIPNPEPNHYPQISDLCFSIEGI